MLDWRTAPSSRVWAPPFEDRLAANAHLPNVVHKEQSPDLIDRYRDFLEEVGYRKASVKEELADDIVHAAAATAGDDLASEALDG